jgi:gliding motility-associated-like protein
MVTNQNCSGSIQLSSDTLQERVIVTPEMDVVSVVPGGVEVSWFPSPSVQTTGYYIYKCVGGLLTVLHDSVFGINNTFYFDTMSDPDTGSVCYSIAAFDQCRNQSLNNVFFGNAHQTMFLQANIQPCEQEVTFNWLPYQNWPDSLVDYQIEVQLDGNPYYTAGNLNNGNSSLSQLSFNLGVDTLEGSNICLRINALHPTDPKNALSNEVCLGLNLIRSTAFNYLRNVTVDTSTNSGFLVDYYIDTAANIGQIRLLKGINDSLPVAVDSFVPSGTIPFPANFQQPGDPNSGPHAFVVESIDDCNFSLPSATGKPIFLTGNTDQTAINQLQWTPFELANSIVLNYRIYRIIDGNWINLATLLPGQLTFDHPILNEPSNDGQFCYVIETNFRLDIPSINVTENLISYSNIQCLQQCPVVYIPNAFVPGGANKVFRPVFLYENIENYEMQIYDRWGKRIFESDVVISGWDGTNNGQSLPLGAYIYRIRASIPSSECREIEKTGTVLLVR